MSFLRFLLVGGVSALVQFAVLALFLQSFGFEYRLSVAVAYIASVMFHFVANRYFTFRLNGVPRVDEIRRYLTIVAINFVVTMIITTSTVEFLDFAPYMAIICSRVKVFDLQPYVATVFPGFDVSFFWSHVKELFTRLEIINIAPYVGTFLSIVATIGIAFISGKYWIFKQRGLQ
jgi:putative flippase GtrA